LHSFEYADAAEAFREVQRLDPDFAMAYWGPIWSVADPSLVGVREAQSKAGAE